MQINFGQKKKSKISKRLCSHVLLGLFVCLSGSPSTHSTEQTCKHVGLIIVLVWGCRGLGLGLDLWDFGGWTLLISRVFGSVLFLNSWGPKFIWLFLLNFFLILFKVFFFFFFFLGGGGGGGGGGGWCWKFIYICSTFTHSFTQFFPCTVGKCKCWTVCFFLLLGYQTAA